MEVAYERPPNYEEIRRTFPILPQTVFAYGTTLYVPSGADIPEHLMVHEAVHSRRQEAPSVWWKRYLADPDFRLDEELEAYAAQYNFVKEKLPKVAKDALFDFASTLSSPLYKLDLTYQQAENMIRLRARTLWDAQSNMKQPE